MIIYCLLEYVSILQCRFASQVIDALKKKSLNNRCCASVLKKIGKDAGSVCVWGGLWEKQKKKETIYYCWSPQIFGPSTVPVRYTIFCTSREVTDLNSVRDTRRTKKMKGTSWSQLFLRTEFCSHGNLDKKVAGLNFILGIQLLEQNSDQNNHTKKSL